MRMILIGALASLLLSTPLLLAQEPMVVEKDGQYFEYKLHRSLGDKATMDSVKTDHQAEKLFLESLTAWTPEQEQWLAQLFNRCQSNGTSLTSAIAERIAEIVSEVGAMDNPTLKQLEIP